MPKSRTYDSITKMTGPRLLGIILVLTAYLHTVKTDNAPQIGLTLLNYHLLDLSYQVAFQKSIDGGSDTLFSVLVILCAVPAARIPFPADATRLARPHAMATCCIYIACVHLYS